MHKYKRAARRQAWYSDNESTNYNPFAKRVTRLHHNDASRAVPLDQALEGPSHVSDDSPPPNDCIDVQPTYVLKVSGIVAQASIAGQVRSS